MRTKKQDEIDRRKLLEREKSLLFPHLHREISSCLGPLLGFDLEEVERNGSFQMTRYVSSAEDVEAVKISLEDHFGATCHTSESTRGEGCCDHCYSENDVDVFQVSNITKNWPTEELAKLAPSPRKTK